MATVLENNAPAIRTSGAPRQSEIQEKPFRPVKMWAAIGVLFLAVETLAVVGWLLGPNSTPTPVGNTPVPGYMQTIIDVWELAAFPVFFLFLWHFLVKPWRRQGRIQSDGLFCLVFATLWWQDPLQNWVGLAFTYNSYLTNYGNWLNNIPGWVMPGAHKVAEAPIWTFPIYVYLVFGASVVGCKIMTAFKRRWPGLTKAQLVLICFACFAAFDIVLEPFLMFIGIWTYTGVVKELSIFYGHYYQFPMYEAVFWGGAWTGWTCLRYFKDDKGRTIVERGIDEVKTSNRNKTVLRFLAIAGACNAIFLVYNAGLQPFILNADPIPQDIQKRSYFMSGICGDGTEYSCYGPDSPLPRRDSAHVGNDGQLKNPRGATFTSPAHATE